MALIGEQNVRNVLIMKAYPNHATMAEARNATIGDGVCVSADGTAPAAGEDFLVGVRNSSGEMTTVKINPSSVYSAGSKKAAAATLPEYTVSIPTSPTAGEVYEIRFVINQFGSLSVEDEYVKSAFYKVMTGDDDDAVADGLVKSLYRNFSREVPTTSKTVTFTDHDGGTHVLPQNNFFDFDVDATAGGTAEVATLTVDTVATEAGNILVTLAGVEYEVPVTAAASVTDQATEIKDWINANAPDHTATSSIGVVTITSKYERLEENLVSDANGVAGFTSTDATTTPGAQGTALQIVIKEKDDWFASYYATGKKTRLDLSYSVTANFGADTGTVTNSVAKVKGVGTGYEVRNVEEYLLGNRQDTFRGAGYPHNFPESYDSELDATYHYVEVQFKDYGRDDEQIASKQSVLIAVKEDIGTFTQVNNLIGDLNTAINGANGVTIPTLS